MTSRDFLRVIFGVLLACGIMFAGCDIFTSEEEPTPEPVKDIISQIEVSGDAKVGSYLYASAENTRGYSASGVSWQWKRSDSEYGTYNNIDGATSNSYTIVPADADKYLKVEARNSDTTTPVLSDAIGPVDANRVAKPTANPAGGEVAPGQGITLSTSTENARIYYTLDGSTPTEESTRYYSSYSTTITENCTLKAIATYYGMTDSEVLTETYTVMPGISFSPVTSSADIFNYGLYSVAYGNNRFVVGGNGEIAYSANGTTWTDATGVSNFLVKGMAYGTQFVAVGYYYSGGIINYSSDGATWTAVTDTTFGTSYINDIAYGGGKYVAVGKDGKMAYSADGTTWTAVANSAFGTSNIYDITYGGGKFIAIGKDGKTAYSTDGTAWIAIPNSPFPPDPNPDIDTTYGITYGGKSGSEQFIAVGGKKLASSTDGLTWTEITTNVYFGSFDILKKITWGNNKFVAVGSGGIVVYSNADGTQWVKIEGGIGTGKSQFNDNALMSGIEDIAYGNGKYLAVGSKGISPVSGEMAIGE